MYCYTCEKEYTSWSGLAYHKRTVHNCTKDFPGLYKCNIESATKLPEERTRECMVCPKRFRKEPMEDDYRKAHKGNFTWICVNLAAVKIEKRRLKIILGGIIYIIKMNAI